MPLREEANRDRASKVDPGGNIGELASRFVRVGRNTAAISASALALLFSGISLYETVLKQAHLYVFVPDTIAYTGDPDGGFEVFVVPLTVSNSGARDGIVSALKLEVRNSATGAKQALEASYFAGPDYFSVKEDAANNIRRPKTPFAPLSVPGRGSFTATVLFYARKYEGQRVVSGGGQYELLVRAETRPVEVLGFLDRLWSTAAVPVRSIYELPPVPQFFEARIYSGNSERMFRAE